MAEDRVSKSEGIADIFSGVGGALLGAWLAGKKNEGRANLVTGAMRALYEDRKKISGFLLSLTPDDEAEMANLRAILGPEDWHYIEILLMMMPDDHARAWFRKIIYSMDNPAGQKVKQQALDKNGKPMIDRDGNPILIDVLQEFSDMDLRVRYLRQIAQEVRKAIERADEALKKANLPGSEKTPELRDAFIAREIRALLDAMKLSGEYRDDLPIQRAKRWGKQALEAAKNPEIRAWAAMLINGAYLTAKEAILEENARREAEITKITTGITKRPFAHLRLQVQQAFWKFIT